MFVRAQRRPGFESDRWYLDAYDRSGGGKRTVFASPDISVTDYALSPDGSIIWFTAAQQGQEALFTVPSAGGSPARVVQVADQFLGRGRSILCDRFQVFVDGAARNLSGFGRRQIHLRADARKRVMVERGVVPGARESHSDRRRRSKDPVLAHQTATVRSREEISGGVSDPRRSEGSWDDAWSARWNPSLWAAQGWVIAAPNPRGSFGFGQTFVDDISGDWGGKVMTDIDAVVNAVAKMPFTDSQRFGIAGASYGGYAVNWILGHTNRFKAAVTHDGVFNLESMSLATEELWFSDWEFGGAPWTAKARAQFARFSPHLYANNIKTPTLIITNERDFRVPVDQGLQMFTVLRRNGVPSQALVFPDEGHWVLKALNGRAWHEAVFGWMKKYLATSS